MNNPTAQPGPTQESATEIWDRRYVTNTGLTGGDGVHGDPLDCNTYPFLYRNSVLKRTTGDPDVSLQSYIGQRHLTPPLARALVIGAGTAEHEEGLIRDGYVENIVAYEMSQAAVESARERISKQPYAHKIELRCADALEDGLPDSSFDLVYIRAAIHHFFNIEEMYALMHRVLKPDGLLIFSEFIGPDHHQFPPDLIEIMDEITACLDTSYRHDVTSNALREQNPRPSLEWMLAHDPSEGVHSSRILPLTYQYFDVVERMDWGGSILRPFFCGILPNFDFSNPKDQTVGRLIILLEEKLIQHGVIPHHFAGIVARRRAVPRNPLTETQSARIAYADWDPAILDQDATPDNINEKLARAIARILPGRLKTALGRILSTG